MKVASEPYVLYLPEGADPAVILSVPHAGRIYPQELFKSARVDLSVLERLEDRFADKIVMELIGDFPVIIAHLARASMDLNRSQQDWEWRRPDQIAGGDWFGASRTPSARARSGLGLVPTRLAGVGQLWKSPPDDEAVSQRIKTIHQPWHGQIASLLDTAVAETGSAVLLDVHSMPRQVGGSPHIVIGDGFGASASGELSDSLLAVAQGAGFDATRNHPYAGAYTVARHGAPLQGRHALQIEFDRSLYLDANGGIVSDGLLRCQQVLRAMALTASDWASRRITNSWPIAAE